MQKILISACLLGENVKYDGTNNDIREHAFIQKMLKLNLLVPVCPETLGGLPTPRIPVEIKEHRAINKEGIDKSDAFELGATLACNIAQEHAVCMAILKSKSPSCGSGYIYDGSFTKTLISGDGIGARKIKENGIKVFHEKQLDAAEAFWNALGKL